MVREVNQQTIETPTHHAAIINKGAVTERSTDARSGPPREAAHPPWLPRSPALDDALIHCLADMARFLLHRERTFPEGNDDEDPGARSRPASPS